MHTCQIPYLQADHGKQTDYIVVLVQGTSGLVFSLASLWWIRKECLVRFFLSLWLFQVIVSSPIHSPPLAPSGMPLTILSARAHWQLDVWNELFDVQLVTLQFRKGMYSSDHSRRHWQADGAIVSHCLKEQMPCEDPLDSKIYLSTIQEMVYTITGKKIWICCPFSSLGHGWRLGVVVPRLLQRKWCLLTSLLHTSCLYHMSLRSLFGEPPPSMIPNFSWFQLTLTS